VETTRMWYGAALVITVVFGLWPPPAAALFFAQDGSATVLHVDASAPIPPVVPADYTGGTNRAPDGSVLGLNNRYLTLNGQPWLPVIGEMHYTRVPEDQWEDGILKMKSAGVNVISTYVIWIHHEEVQGQWDWQGRRDLRRFAELCRKHNMLLFVRIGPWAHGEARNGGLPDWVVQASPVRQLDPTFMAETHTFYDQIAAQVRGLLWKDGGPIIGVQIENEYAMRGPGQGAPYILALKKMAVDAGLDVPLYTVTGWDNAVVPPHEVLPVYGGYPDAPWGSARDNLPPQEVYVFRFGSRVSGSMGMIGAPGTGGTEESAGDTGKTPFVTAEIGGGNEDTYHRRPVINANDIAAIVPVMLGSGVNAYGTYMFHGGENPQGKLTTLEESQATHYPTDVPVMSYDFQAPIGEFGMERPSLRLLKTWNYFLEDFGALLAPMPAFAPGILPKSPTDLTVLRWSARTDGHAGFLFVNNYVRGGVMPAHPKTQFSIALPGGRTELIPAVPVDIPTGAFFAWPFGLDLDGLHLRYGTAQLMARVHRPEGDTFVFTCIHGIPCQLVFDGSGLRIQAPQGIRVEQSAGSAIVTKPVTAAADFPELTVNLGGTMVHLLLLAPEHAADTWKVPETGEDHLLQTKADVFSDGNTITLLQLTGNHFQFALYPKMQQPPQASVKLLPGGAGTFLATVPPFSVAVTTTVIKSAGQVPPVTLGPKFSWRPTGVAEAPDQTIWNEDAAQWAMHLKPATIPAGVRNLFLHIAYTGDQARLQSEGKLLDDSFFNGQPWLVGLDRFASSRSIPALDLSLLPFRSDSPVWLPKDARTRIAKTGQTVSLNSVTAIPEYELQISCNPRQ
jgi:beta-galactosidase